MGATTFNNPGPNDCQSAYINLRYAYSVLATKIMNLTTNGIEVKDFNADYLNGVYQNLYIFKHFLDKWVLKNPTNGQYYFNPQMQTSDYVLFSELFIVIKSILNNNMMINISPALTNTPIA